MHQQFNIPPEERKRAKWPHEIFLINLIFNHIFIFCATVAVFSTFPFMPVLVPVISFSIISYIFIRSRQIAAGNESWFVKAHWQIAAKRNRFFMLLLMITCAITGGGFWLSKLLGWAKVPTIALIGGVGLLPFMVTLLVLIVLGNESVFVAKEGKLPKRFAAQSPDLQSATATEAGQAQ